MNEYYGHTSKKKYTKEENLRFWKQRRDYQLENIVSDEELGVKHPATLLLDSSLITRSNFKTYSHKIVECGKYLQVYTFPNTKHKIISKKDKLVPRQKIQLRFLEEKKEIEDIPISKEKNEIKLKEIDIKNINRSKMELQRLVKTNEDIFKTFITLTFEDNVKDISYANDKFTNWRRYIKKVKSDFAYVCVPEFQKRGAVHYHLLTNIDYTDFSMLSKEEMRIYKPKKGYQIFRTLNSWSHGFSNVQSMDNINVVGYITKYMTKDIDNRLWGHRRYLYSQNLKKPTTSYIDLETANIVDFLIYNDNIKKYNLKVNSVYADKFGQVIEFQEFKLKESDEHV